MWMSIQRHHLCIQSTQSKEIVTTRSNQQCFKSNKLMLGGPGDVAGDAHQNLGIMKPNLGTIPVYSLLHWQIPKEEMSLKF